MMLSGHIFSGTASAAALLTILVAASNGCSEKGPVPHESQHACTTAPAVRTIQRPIYRFVDRTLRQAATWNPRNAQSTALVETPASPLATTTLPTATIDDDTRFVLESPRHAIVFYQSKYRVTDALKHTFSLVIKRPLPYATRLIVMPSMELHRHWQALPEQLVVLPANAAFYDFELAFPSTVKTQVVNVRIDAVWADWSNTVTYQTPQVHIPVGAKLEFATGVLREKWKNAEIDFELKACRGTGCVPLFTESLNEEETADSSWVEHTLALNDLQGQGWRFVFEARQKGNSSDSRVFPVWANPTVYAPAAIRAGNPNVILLSIDTLRADVLPDYGEEDNTTPFIRTKFGKDGSVFENCTAAASSTSPSHMTMLTGLQPSTHGVKTGLERLDGRLNTVAEMLRDVSVETGAITEDGWLGTRHGFARGFNVYVENKSADIMSPDGQVDLTFNRAERWLRRHRDTHFFLFLHTFQVHAPYTPPHQYRKLFRHQGSAVLLPAEDVMAAHEKMLYKQELRYTDDELARLFTVLAELGLDKNTVFILISDHGEAFREHGYYGHGAHLYEEVVHVPLMLTGPCIAPGHRLEQLVGHIDLTPTLLDMFAVNPPYEMQGHSFLSLAQGRNHNRSLDGQRYYSESWSEFATIAPGQRISFQHPAFSVRSGSTKLVRYPDKGQYRYEYFDLAHDPLERHNLWPERRAEIKGLVSALASYEWRRARNRRVHESIAGAPPRPHTGFAGERVVLDPAQEEKLRALGYLQ